VYTECSDIIYDSVEEIQGVNDIRVDVSTEEAHCANLLMIQKQAFPDIFACIEE